jgi:hypothetical protein
MSKEKNRRETFGKKSKTGSAYLSLPDTAVFWAFEEDYAPGTCRNYKQVIEALILHWLDADPESPARPWHKTSW